MTQTAFEALPGRGVKCIVKGRRVFLGNRKLMQEQGIADEIEADMAKLEGEGKTAMILAVDGKAAGIVAAMDTPKEHAVEAIAQLKEHEAWKLPC